MSKKNDFRVVMLDYIDMTLYDYSNPGEWGRVGKIMRSILTPYLQMETMRNGLLEERTDIVVERIMVL